jgi:ferric-dicitrate binding protein FerR (iron transport regulator)
MKREPNDTNDDQAIEALLREVGGGYEPPHAAAEEIHRAVHQEWLATVAQRKRRQRVVTFGIAASVAFVALVASWALTLSVSSAELPLSIAYIDGVAQFQPSAAEPVRVLSAGESLPVGSVLVTDGATRIALAYGTDVSMRLDRRSKLERIGPDRFRLSEGAVYIDARPQAAAHDLVVETLAGEVRHLGTQYQIRQGEDVVEVSIREGRVEIKSTKGAALGSAGERVQINAAGDIKRDALSAQDPGWDWAEAASPPFAINDRTLAEFLEWVARETGRQIVYASPDAQHIAQSLKLRGSIEGLDPETALSAVLSTTEFVRYQTSESLIGVQLARSDRAER